MFTRLLFPVVLLSTVALQTKSLPAQEPPPPIGSACLPADSPEMQGLLYLMRKRVSSDVGSAPQWRERLFEGKKMPPGAVMPVQEEEVCAKVVRLLKADVGFADSTANAAAVVRVDGKYVASFWFRVPELGVNIGTFYFDRGFTRVVVRSR